MRDCLQLCTPARRFSAMQSSSVFVLFVLVCSQNRLVLHNRVVYLEVHVLVVLQVYLYLREPVSYVVSVEVSGFHELWTVSLLRSCLHQAQSVCIR
jgi:hypothetical protein